MLSKVRQKEQAITLRKRGLTYNEILQQVPVAKSSLSLWLKDLPLNEDEKKLLKHRKDGNISRGRIRAANALHKRREVRDALIAEEAKRDFEKSKDDPFFQLGLGLYWAEGSKRYSSFEFVNSDPDMIRIMVAWMKSFLDLSTSQIKITLYLHKAYAHENCEDFWSKKIGIPVTQFNKTVYKASDLLYKKRPGYRGCIRIGTAKVKYLRKYKFWQQMLVEYLGK